jgi:hypothetical protein
MNNPQKIYAAEAGEKKRWQKSPPRNNISPALTPQPGFPGF